MTKNSAIVVVDMLYDFIDGSLACMEAEQAVDNTAKYIAKCKLPQDQRPPVLFIRDCHPADHCSFKANGGEWPVHCVKGTHGGDIHEKLRPFVEEGLEFFKGTDPAEEQYSGFEGLNEAGQSLAEVLEILDCSDVYVCGIATEFCVKNTVLDLLKAGFRVTVLSECLAYVNAEGHKTALAEMEKTGARIA